MDGPIGTTNAGTPGPTSTPGSVPAPVAGAVAAPAGGPLVALRPITLVTGQQLQATVTAILGGGLVRLGLLGGTLEASTHLQLEAGRSYWFTVAATSPQVVLAAARPGAIHALAGAFPEELLGLGGRRLAALLEALPQPAASAAPANAPLRQPPQAGDHLDDATAFRVRPAEPPAARELQALARTLGHDQEARVLRLLQLPAAVREAAAETLRRTGKARALQVLEHEPAVSEQAAKARTLVDGLNQIEREDAARAEAGAPQWLPLPAVAGGPLRDARMFLMRPRTDGEARAGADAEAARAAFTIVLLLDFTRLGAVRADLTLAGESLQATITVSAEASLRLLRRGAADLERRWTDSGLKVQSLQLRLAPQGRLPVADLVAPPRAGDPQAVVDVHA